MESFLEGLLPRLLPESTTFRIHTYQGKPDLLGKLENRLRGFAQCLPNNHRIVVVVDRDNEDCKKLKRTLETTAKRAGLKSRSEPGSLNWQIVNRIAIEELEAWYFGDWKSVRAAWPRVPAGIPRKRQYRNPDEISGGTWEAFERVLRKASYFPNGLRKIEAAKIMGIQIDPHSSTSPSFRLFCQTIMGIFK